MGDAYTYLEIFAGAGGLSEGFLRSNFTPVAHIEKDGYASLTLKTRLAYYHLKEYDNLMVYEDYIRGIITRERLYSSVPGELIDSVINIEIKENNLEHIFKKTIPSRQSRQKKTFYRFFSLRCVIPDYASQITSVFLLIYTCLPILALVHR